MPETRVYPDTNIALHYKAFDQIDWCALVGSTELVVVITSVFLREIDHQKDRERGNVQKRAKSVNAWLGKLRRSKSTELRKAVRIEVNHSEPETEVVFADHGLVATVNDDKLLACMIRDHLKYPDAVLVCVTADIALAFKVEAKGFVVIEPLDADRVSDGLDPAQAEIRELRKELAELKSRAVPQPQLAVHFPGKATHLVVPISNLAPFTDRLIEEHLEREAQMLSFQSSFNKVLWLEPPSESDIAGYRKKLGDWLRWYGPDAVARGLTFGLELLLSNDGSGNAEDIDVDLTFPESVFVAESRILPTGPKKPKRPEARRVMDMSFGRGGIGYPRSFLDSQRVVERELRALDRVQLVCAEGRRHEIGVHVRSMKHQSEVKMPHFDAWFCSASDVLTGFAIGYRIHAASSPKIVEGTLNVQITSQPGRIELSGEDDEGPEEFQEESDVTD